jgi:hypothetical protein
MASKLMSHFLAAALASLAGCGAKVDSTPLRPDGTVDTSKASGIRYYLPKPYLLITELPEKLASGTGNPNPNGTKLGAGAGGGPGGGGAKTGTGEQSQGPSGSQPQSSTPTATASNTSFSASTADYSVKLVYLPDYSQPMALTMRAGLFGSVSMAPTLQDGWMLTGMTGSGDNTAAATLLASVLGGGSSTASGTAAGAAKTAAKAAALGATVAQVSPAMSNDQLAQLGRQIGQGALLAPPPQVLNALKPSQLVALLGGIASGLSTGPSAAQLPSIPWGKNVLPAGLYELVYAPASAGNGGQLTGLRAVAYFCNTGVVPATASQVTPCPHDSELIP